MPVMMRTVRGIVALVTALGSVAMLGFQDGRGELAGVAKDKSGGVLPGVVVMLAAPSHREPLVQVTRADGSYHFTSLPAGSYTASFRLSGFLESAREGVVVDDGQRAELNATLVLAAAAAETAARPGAAATTPVQPPTIPVRLETPFGDIDIAVDTVNAPITATNFLKYVDGGFYDGGRFHRTTRPDTYNPLLPNRPPMAIIQGGINPAAHPGIPPIPLERTSVTGLKHVVGVVSMARGGPDTATSDFFIMLDDQPSLDFGGKRFDDAQGAAAFGRVTAGLDVVKLIQQRPVSDRQPTPDNPLTHTQNLTPPVPITKGCRFARAWGASGRGSAGCAR